MPWSHNTGILKIKNNLHNIGVNPQVFHASLKSVIIFFTNFYVNYSRIDLIFHLGQAVVLHELKKKLPQLFMRSRESLQTNDL